jgi:hypothetical protein
MSLELEAYNKEEVTLPLTMTITFKFSILYHGKEGRICSKI